MAKNKTDTKIEPTAKTKGKADSKAKRDKKPVRRQPNAVRRFFNETIGELKKVSWPTRKEATNLTWVVLAVTVSMSLFLGLLDAIFNQVFKMLLG